MTTIDHDARRHLELVHPTGEDNAGELVQPAPPADPEQLNQTHGDDSTPGTELVPVDQVPTELAERPPVTPPAVVEGRVLAARRTPAATRPILPAWLRSWDTFLAAAVWLAGRSGHLLAFHGLRLPLYWLKLVGRSPVGLARTLGAWSRWVSDSPGRAVRDNLAKGPGITPDSFYRVTEQHRDQVRGRLAVSTASVVALAVTVFGFISAAPGWAVGVGIVLGFVLFGALGRSADAPILAHSTSTDSVPRLTQDLILTALGSIGIAELNKAVRTDANTAVRFPAPITRDGPGFRADIDLPPGVTAGDVIERRDRLASGLRRPEGCVWPESDPESHAGRLVLWVGDKPMAKTKPVVWPLLKTGAVDLFAPFPIGVDPRGRPITLTLMFALMIIGALPRIGKTFFMRLLALAAALDPTAELHIYDLKGGADWLPLEPVAHRFRVGDDPDDLAYFRTDVRAIHADMSRRYKVLRSLPREVCPEGKITRALANRRELGLFPVVLFIDECQHAFDGDKDTVALITDLGKRGPAAGIIVVLATQRVDAQSLPTGISSNAVLRYCLKVAGQVENDMVLGTSMYKAGFRATMFSRTDLGVGYLAGEGDDPVIVRGAYLDANHAAAVVARARAARLAAGTLTGHAAGIEPDPDPSDQSLLDHLAEVWPLTEEGPVDKVWWDDLAIRLAETFPGLYSGWTGKQVSTAAKPHGLNSGQVKRTIDGRQLNRRGLTHTDLAAALRARDAEGGAEQLDQAADGWPQLPGPTTNPDDDRSDLR